MLEGLVPSQGGCERRPGSLRLRVGLGLEDKGILTPPPQAVRRLQDKPPWHHSDTE